MMATARQDPIDLYFKQGSCRIILRRGDLLRETGIDAIVIPIPIPTSNTDNPAAYVLFSKFYSEADKKTKENIDKVCSNVKPSRPHFVVIGTMKYILTSSPYMDNPRASCNMLKETYTACLDLAIKNAYRSVAFPTIGCGQSGFTPEQAAENSYQALANLGESKIKKLDEIRMIIYDDGIWDTFVGIFRRLSQDKKSPIKFEKESTQKPSSNDSPVVDDERKLPREKYESSSNNRQTSSSVSKRDGSPDETSSRSKPLNKNAAEFHPTNDSWMQKRRIPRRFHINNNQTELIILQGDITRTEVDAIVNAANESMTGGGGVDGVIHRAAGYDFTEACRAHKQIYPGVRLPIGHSCILLSYNMSKTTDYIINTAGPVYYPEDKNQCAQDLASCYKTSLDLANLYDLKSIGFTAISCGIFGYPADDGADVALRTVDREAGSMRQIFFVLLDNHIYDAWIKKAEELQLVSMDVGCSALTNLSKQPIGHEKTPVRTPDSDEHGPEGPFKLNVIDLSTQSPAAEPNDHDTNNQIFQTKEKKRIPETGHEPLHRSSFQLNRNKSGIDSTSTGSQPPTMTCHLVSEQQSQSDTSPLSPQMRANRLTSTNLNRCEIEQCDNVQSAICLCCSNKLCYDHVTQHNQRLLSDAHILCDQVNGLLLHIDTKCTSVSTQTVLDQLETWRLESIQSIESIYKEQRRLIDKIEQTLNTRLNNFKQELTSCLTHIRTPLDHIQSKQITNRQEIEHIAHEINSIQSQIDGLQCSILLHTKPIDFHPYIYPEGVWKSQSIDECEHDAELSSEHNADISVGPKTNTAVCGVNLRDRP